MALKVICTLALLAVVNAQRCLDYRNWQDFLGDSCQRCATVHSSGVAASFCWIIDKREHVRERDDV